MQIAHPSGWLKSCIIKENIRIWTKTFNFCCMTFLCLVDWSKGGSHKGLKWKFSPHLHNEKSVVNHADKGKDLVAWQCLTVLQSYNDVSLNMDCRAGLWSIGGGMGWFILTNGSLKNCASNKRLTDIRHNTSDISLLIAVNKWVSWENAKIVSKKTDQRNPNLSFHQG